MSEDSISKEMAKELFQTSNGILRIKDIMQPNIRNFLAGHCVFYEIRVQTGRNIKEEDLVKLFFVSPDGDFLDSNMEDVQLNPNRTISLLDSANLLNAPWVKNSKDMQLMLSDFEVASFRYIRNSYVLNNNLYKLLMDGERVVGGINISTDRGKYSIFSDTQVSLFNKIRMNEYLQKIIEQHKYRWLRSPGETNLRFGPEPNQPRDKAWSLKEKELDEELQNLLKKIK